MYTNYHELYYNQMACYHDPSTYRIGAFGGAFRAPPPSGWDYLSNQSYRWVQNRQEHISYQIIGIPEQFQAPIPHSLPQREQLSDNNNAPIGLVMKEDSVVYNPQSDEIDTAYVVECLSRTLRLLRISQTHFARKIIQRSQGTLSDLLANPKPWNLLKSGKTIYQKMHAFLLLSDEHKMQIMAMEPEDAHAALGFEFQKKKERKKRTITKKPRIMFDVHQKSVLDELSTQSPRPSMEQIEEIAKSIHVSTSSVSNYIQNARRRFKRAICEQMGRAKEKKRQ